MSRRGEGRGGRLDRRFFGRYTPRVARELIGARLVRNVDGERMVAEIVETEAYRGAHDPASHAFRGMTRRNSVMFGEPGHAYVYFTMGKHYCLNLTTEPAGTPAAVLIRAVAPLQGMAGMGRRRGVSDVRRLASGPGNLARALSIDKSLNGEDVVHSTALFLERGNGALRVRTSARVGVSAGESFRWRYFAEGNSFVSKGRPSRAQKP